MTWSMMCAVMYVYITVHNAAMFAPPTRQTLFVVPMALGGNSSSSAVEEEEEDEGADNKVTHI
jgi:hypothetical protein